MYWFSPPPSDPSKTTVFMERCPCGFDRNHGRVRRLCDYSTMGAVVAVFFGALAWPRKVTYRCMTCDSVLAETRDPAILATQH